MNANEIGSQNVKITVKVELAGKSFSSLAEISAKEMREVGLDACVNQRMAMFAHMAVRTIAKAE